MISILILVMVIVRRLRLLVQIDSFIDIIYPKDAEAWKHWLSPSGKIEEWVSTGRRTERPDWVSAEVRLPGSLS